MLCPGWEGPKKIAGRREGAARSQGPCPGLEGWRQTPAEDQEGTQTEGEGLHPPPGASRGG